MVHCLAVRCSAHFRRVRGHRAETRAQGANDALDVCNDANNAFEDTRQFAALRGCERRVRGHGAKTRAQSANKALDAFDGADLVAPPLPNHADPTVESGAQC